MAAAVVAAAAGRRRRKRKLRRKAFTLVEIRGEGRAIAEAGEVVSKGGDAFCRPVGTP
jgi:hypothetical protein